MISAEPLRDRQDTAAPAVTDRRYSYLPAVATEICRQCAAFVWLD
jgi:hypothetical protein